MDELLSDFLAETTDHLDQVGAQIVQFERDPSNTAIIAQIFRLIHTVKGTSGFLDLPRLERLSHSAETLIGRARDRAGATPEEVTLILTAIDRLREILNALEETGKEPDGDDEALVAALESEIAMDDARQLQREPAAADAAPATQRSAEETPAARLPLTNVQDVAASGEAERHSEQAPARPEQQPQAAPREPSTIRVALGTLEHIMRLVSELVLARNQLLDVARQRDDEFINAPMQRLSAITSDLQDRVMQARMQPIDRVFANLPRMVRDLSHDLGKKVDLVVEGNDTELDRQLVELIRDPLTHLLRNCIDHGIETPNERLAANKSATGTIRIGASQDAGHITIEIADDGRGINVNRIREKAIALQLASEAEIEGMKDDDICRFIFAHGFSTANTVTNVSGRGIGMDVVRENIESIGGTVALNSTRGRGTTFTLRIPLTLAIAPALIVEAGGQRYALPQHAVVETVACNDGSGERISIVQDALMLRLRDNIIPVADLTAMLDASGSACSRRHHNEGFAIVMRAGAVNFALKVDQVTDVQEIVVKPLSRTLSRLGIYSGNTILGDGSVVLILNPNGIATAIGLEAARQYQVVTSQYEGDYEAESTSLVLFRAGQDSQKAIPLSLISRIERISPAAVRRADTQFVIEREGRLMPVMPLCDLEDEAAQWNVLVIGVGGEYMGLLVGEIVDIVDQKLDIELSGTNPSVIGSTTVGGQATEILDVAYYMKLLRPNAFERRHAKRFRVLLIDDKKFFLDMLAPVISAAGYDVSTANGGADALKMIRRGAVFDIIATDLDMPHMDGYELTRQIREIPNHGGKPVIALDAYAGQSVLAATRSAGIDKVVGKFDRAALRQALSEILAESAFNTADIEARVTGEAAA